MTAEQIRSLLLDSSLRLLASPTPAEPGAIASLVRDAPMELPDDYLHLLAVADGVQGDLGMAPGWVMLWPAAAVTAGNRSCDVLRRHPGFLAVGTSGGFGFGPGDGDVVFAFRIEEGSGSAVYGIPGECVDASEIRTLVDNFGAFVRAIGRLCPGDAA
jgi:hypothetical protein